MVVSNMELNERKLKILQAIINSYLDTAEPVGSRTISKNYDLGVSPATIRNEMSDLEELGFIEQPHTSAGRIPSDKGYRLYVDTLMNLRGRSKHRKAMLEDLVKRAGHIEVLLQQIASVLAKATNYAAIVSTPQYNRSSIKNIQLIEIEPKKLMAVIVTDGNNIKNYVIDLEMHVEQKTLNKITFVLNHELYGKTVEMINLPLIEELKEFAGENKEIISKVLEVVFKTIREVDDVDIYTSGAINMLRLPEFSNMEKATNLIEAFENKDKLKGVLMKNIEDVEECHVKVSIGEENEIEEMKDCSLVTTTYHIGGRPLGVIGIIGPKRMDYMNAIGALRCLIKDMEELINDS